MKDLLLFLQDHYVSLYVLAIFVVICKYGSK